MNSIEFHQNGQEAHQALMKLLNSAQQSLDIAIFILGDDQVGWEILSCLEHKAAQGVKIRLLLDGVGSLMLPKRRLKKFIKNGGQTAWFIPVLHRPMRGRTNLRNHRKIVIADGSRVWTGGRNLAIGYLAPDKTGNSWIDLSFCQQGPAVSTYQQIFTADWCFATNSPVEERIFPQTTSAGESLVQIIPSGPDVADDAIYVTILTACYEATERILIVTPYYIPDTGVQEALRLAALRGVKVDLVLPVKSNHRLADIARNRYLRELDQVGIRIWFFPNNMVHAKALVVDKDFSMAGSANLDIRSLFLNYEVMSGFYSEKDIEWLAAWIKALRDKSHRYSPAPASKFTEMVEGIVLLTAYQL
jgi:cardiolipin synthase